MHLSATIATLTGLLLTSALAAPAAPEGLRAERRTDPVPAEIHPDLNAIYIKDFTYGGTGCPEGSVARMFSSDRKMLSVIFDQYAAYSGQGVKTAENRKACQLAIKIHIPHGWQYTLFQSDMRGFYDLSKGSRGYCTASYFFSGSSQTASSVAEFVGPSSGEFTKTNLVGVESLAWSPCGDESLLNMKTALNIRALGTDKPNLLQLDSADVKFEQKLYLSWRKCTPPAKPGKPVHEEPKDDHHNLRPDGKN